MKHPLIKKKFFNYLLIGFLIVVIFFILNKNYHPIRSGLFFITKPFTSFFSRMGFWSQDKIDFIFSIGELKKENENLFEENLKLRADIAEFKNIQEENEKLRKQLDLAPRDKFEIETAMVIGRDLNQSEEIIYIGKGSKNGIESGMPVLSSEGFLLGKVSQVFLSTSEVELILNRDIRINAEIQESGARGIIRGDYGTAVIMDMIPQTIEINAGDTVITSGVGNVMPKGILIGYVKDVGATSDRLFQKASLSLPFSFNEIEVVSIIKNQSIK